MNQCMVCQREISFRGACIKCRIDTTGSINISKFSRGDELILRLASIAMRSSIPGQLIGPIAMHLAEQPEMDFEKLAKICDSILVKSNLIISTKNSIGLMSRDEVCMIQWILCRLKLTISQISQYMPGITRIDIENTKEKEQDFRSRLIDVNAPTLFHGSMDTHWYSIIRDGLKNMSKTSLSLNGASFGNGIYFSDDMRTALSYCKHSKIRLIAACQPCTNIKKWERGKNTYVVPDDKLIIVRYLLMINVVDAKL
jgi:hypothetical protein